MQELKRTIETELTTRRFGRPLHVRERVGSTNDEAAVLAGQGALEGTAVIAAVQTRGRGRRGRTWHSPDGGLWLSVVLRPTLPPELWPLVGMAVAVGTAAAIEEVAQVQARVKWPNDVMAGERKLGGVLVEVRGSAAVAGLGINANVSPADLAPEVQPAATSLLALTGRPVDLAALACAVLGECERYYDLLHGDPGALLARWRGRDMTLGRRVRVWGAQELEGVAEDVDQTGALLVRTMEGRRRVVAGDVSLRTVEVPQE